MIAGNLKSRFHIADEPFARGGEGCVHNVDGRPELVAKIYHPLGRTTLREEKIKAMLQSSPSGQANVQIAWPQEILYDAASGAFLGFVMPRIQNVSKIDTLYSYDKRKQHHWAWYVQVAQNLCAAVHSVHKSGHVIGDMNPANICVDPRTALVTLVDTDSYSVYVNGGQVYPCTVCREEYVPAEIHRILDGGANLKSFHRETFTVYTDYFALALHVFALLMNGCHPYACTVREGFSEERYNLLENIRRGFFPFTAHASGVGIPRYAPALNALPPQLRQLCTRSFVEGCRRPARRATDTEWHFALDALERELAQCGANRAHQYWERLPACPWCASAASMNTLLANQKKAASRASARLAVSASPGTSGAGGATARRAPQKTYHPPSGPLRRFFSGVGRVLGSFGGGIAPAAGVIGIGLATILAVVLGLGLWLGWNVLGHWLLSQVPLSAWWWTLIRYASLGIIPFVPLWLFAIIASFGFGFAEAAANILARTTRWATLLLYGGVAIYFGIGNGLINIVLWTVFACLPSVMMCRWFPGITWDMDW